MSCDRIFTLNRKERATSQPPSDDHILGSATSKYNIPLPRFTSRLLFSRTYNHPPYVFEKLRKAAFHVWTVQRW
jgi:hypothetical protein